VGCEVHAYFKFCHIYHRFGEKVMKAAILSTLMAGVALVALANPAGAAVLPLFDNDTLSFASTTTPLSIDGGSYAAPLSITPAVTGATWQFVVPTYPAETPVPLYKIAISGTASDTNPGDLSLAGATLNLEKGGVILGQTITFTTANAGVNWAPTVWQSLNLGGGTYQLVLAGAQTLGHDHAAFAGTVSITPVPELSTWAMMLAGFGALGFAGYRRRAFA
jgi:hypothetical protein